jgi:hypothetical protein
MSPVVLLAVTFSLTDLDCDDLDSLEGYRLGVIWDHLMFSSQLDHIPSLSTPYTSGGSQSVQPTPSSADFYSSTLMSPHQRGKKFHVTLCLSHDLIHFNNKEFSCYHVLIYYL